MLAAFPAGTAKEGDLEVLHDVINKIEGTTICALAEAFCWPVRSFVNKYRHEFEAHLA